MSQRIFNSLKTRYARIPRCERCGKALDPGTEVVSKTRRGPCRCKTVRYCKPCAYLLKII